MLPEINNYLSNVNNPAIAPSNGLLLPKKNYPSNGLHSFGGNPGIDFSANIGKISTGINILNNLGSAFVDTEEDTSSNMQKQIGNIAFQSTNPYVKAAGALWNTLSTIGDLTDTNSNTMSEAQQNAAGISNFSKVLNNTLSYIPMAGSFMSKTNGVNKSDDVDALRGGYSESANFIDAMESMGEKRYINGNKINNNIITANEQAKMLAAINRTSTLRKNSNAQQEFQHQINQRYGLFAKNGVKLLSKEELKKIYSYRKGIAKFQNGGSILIPDGALHKNKHNMEDINPELAKELTTKGIPVVVTDKEGNVEQCAEIERNEMILEKSLTNKIEELWRKGDEESMIKCGKIIVCTLFNNCDDNTGLVKEVE